MQQSEGRMAEGAFAILRRGLYLLGCAELILASIAFLVICTVVGANAFLRYVLNSSLIWAEEVSMLSIRVVIFLGAAVILKSNQDIAVNLLVTRLAPARRRMLRIATYALATVFFAVLAAQCIWLWPIQKNVTTLILEFSRYWLTVPLLFASLSMLLTSACRTMEELLAPGLPPVFLFEGEPE